MATDSRQTRERIFSFFSLDTRRLFAHRENEMYDNSKVCPLILEMLLIESSMKTKPITATHQKESVMNQGDKPLPFANGVKFSYGSDGKPIFEDA